MKIHIAFAEGAFGSYTKACFRLWLNGVEIDDLDSVQTDESRFITIRFLHPSPEDITEESLPGDDISLAKGPPKVDPK